MTPDQEADFDRLVKAIEDNWPVDPDTPNASVIADSLVLALDRDRSIMRTALESRSSLTALVITLALAIGCGCGYFGRWVTEPSHAHAAP